MPRKYSSRLIQVLAAIAIAIVISRCLRRTIDPEPPAPRATAQPMAAKRLADARPAEPAPSAPDLDPEVAATLTLGSPDPAEVAGDGPRRWQRRLVDQFLRDMERRGPQAMPRTAEPPSKETVARFTAEMTAAMEERTDP